MISHSVYRQIKKCLKESKKNALENNIVAVIDKRLWPRINKYQKKKRIHKM